MDNKFLKKTHGQALLEISRALNSYLRKYPDAILVRERALLIVIKGKTSVRTISTLHKVVGVSDLCAWSFGKRTFQEVPPRTVKTLVAGDSKADKAAVAAG